MSCQHQDRTAFTLLEMLIVVVVMAILAAIIIPQMSEAAGNAKVAKILQVTDVARTAVQAHHADTGRLAREFSNSADNVDRQLSIPQTYGNWNGPYFAHPLTDGDNPYGGIVRIYDNFNDGPVHPVGFDLTGRGADTSTGTGQYILFSQISEAVAHEVDRQLDQGISGDWRATGRVEWSNGSLMVFLMDLIDSSSVSQTVNGYDL